jgi:hypothetical protein
MVKVAIHQPNFMPWYPFFQKVAAVDVFCILTKCQFEKNNFQNRFKLGDRWHTMSVNKGLDPIETKRYLNPNEDWNKINENLKEFSEELERFKSCITGSLAGTNISIIREACQILGINTKIVYDWNTELLNTERLVDICETFEADTYLAGSGGSASYLDTDMFSKKGIDVVFQSPETMIKKPLLEVLKYGPIDN